MNYNLRVLKQYFRVSLLRLVEFKLDFLIRIFLEIVYMFTTYIFSSIITSFTNIGIEAMELFIYGQLVDLTWGYSRMFGFDLTSNIRSGGLTTKLIRPTNILIDLIGNNISIMGNITYLMKGVFIIILCYVYGIDVLLVLLIITFSLTICLLFMIFYMFFVGTLELVKPGLSDLFKELINYQYFSTHIRRFPSSMFPKFFALYMGLFPVYYLSILILSTIKMTNLYLFYILIPIQVLLLIIMIILSNYTWNKYLKNYEAEGG